MATFTVTAATDVVDANDGVLSLREAVSQANASAAADTVVFASTLFFVNVGSFEDRSPLTIEASGGALTINGDRDDDGQGDIILTNGFANKFLVKEGANLTLVGLDIINGNSQGGIAASGAIGARGESSVVPPGPTTLSGGLDTNHDGTIDAIERAAGLTYYGQNGPDTGAAGTGVAGGAGEAGENRGGAIVNAGTLTLIRVGFGDNNAEGGLGGSGGTGGAGGFTFRGRDGVGGHVYTPPFEYNTSPNPLWLSPGHGGNGGDGGDGGDGGVGGRGGAGGHAGGAILNEVGATLSMTDVVFAGRLVSGFLEEGNSAKGGNGGRGGSGGWASAGGIGGAGGNDGYNATTRDSGFSYRDENGVLITFPVESILTPGRLWSGTAGVGGDGGDGGNGGDAGANGRAGSAAAAILNLGTLTGRAAVSDLNTATAGLGGPLGGAVGTGGNAANGAAGGVGGREYPNAYVDPPLGSPVPPPITTTTATSGSAGLNGFAGANGSAGAAGQASKGIVTLAPGTASVTTAELLVYVHRIGGSADATDTISFNIIRIGDFGSTLTVNWRIVGTGTQQATAADFVGGVLPSGSVSLAEVTGFTLGASYDRYAAGLTTAKSIARVDVNLAAAGIDELREGFRIELTSVASSTPSVTAALGTAAVSGFIAGIAPPSGPTAGPNSLTGGAGADSIAGLGGNDTMLGLAGHDTLNGGTGADSMIGAAGNDYYYVDSALDRVVELAGGGTDYVITTVTHTAALNVENLLLAGVAAINGTGNTLANLITGNGAANLLSGLGANDTLNGGAGNDTLDGGAGTDRLVGGANNDTYVVDSLTDVVVELLNQGIDTARTGLAAYTLGLNVENLTATTATAHAFTGNTLANAITGNTGADTLNGAAGNDTLDGGAGLDRLLGGLGDDLFIAQTGDVVIEYLNQGTDTVIVTGGGAFTLGLNVEALVLGGTVANGTGNTLGNTIIGNGAINVLQGLAGADILAGEGGNDILIGGTGRDTMTGGAGADQFRLTSLADSTVAAPDLITDFTFVAGTLDRISLSLIDANTALAGDQAFTYRGANFTGAAGDLRVQATGGGVYVAAGDVDGNSTADFAITIQSATAPAALWFIL